MLALIPLALSLAPYLGRWLGGALGSGSTDAAIGAAVATQAAELVRTVTGTDDPAEAAAILEADPAKRADLQIRLAEIANARETAYYAEVANARQQTIDLAKTGSSLAWGAPLVTLLVFGLFAYTVVGSPPADVGTLETIKTVFIAACTYWIGSSRGSAAKDERR
ncbi:MAG: hypothetical protein JWP04_443 [Belnapia sp.]|nr:hypothetical protein [Belnapia sp.]